MAGTSCRSKRQYARPKDSSSETSSRSVSSWTSDQLVPRSKTATRIIACHVDSRAEARARRGILARRAATTCPFTACSGARAPRSVHHWIRPAVRIAEPAPLLGVSDARAGYGEHGAGGLEHAARPPFLFYDRAAAVEP